MKMKFYKLTDHAAEIAPARTARAWMDETMNRFAYRCLPLSIANATGWEVLSPGSFDILYNGGEAVEDIRIISRTPGFAAESFAASHFAHGVVTFHVSYLIRTPPGWGVFVMGAPNWPKDGIQPLAGLIQTDWLPFPFTMNWKLTRAGRYTVEKGEPVCFIMPVPHFEIEAIEPEVYSIQDHPELMEAYADWSAQREDFNKRLARGEEGAMAEAWQRWYLQGKRPDGLPIGVRHTSKRKMKPLKPGAPGTAREWPEPNR